MDQYKVIETLYHWLRENRWSEVIRVRCDHVTQGRETLGLYLGPKLPGRGRTDQIAQVDILVSNEERRTVELIIEVEPNPNPKKVLGDILPVLIADNYTPSNSYSPYKIDRTLIVFVTSVKSQAGSQKMDQFDRIERALNTRLDLASLGVRSIHLCHGRNEDEVVARCQELILKEFAELGEMMKLGKPTTPKGEDLTIQETRREPEANMVPRPRLNGNFDKGELRRLLDSFRGAVKRRIDVSLATHLHEELLNSDSPNLRRQTILQLARWCKTNGQVYSDGMEIARQVSRLLFGEVLDRDKLGT